VDAKTTREDVVVVRTVAALPALLPIITTARPRPQGRDGGLKSKDDISTLCCVENKPSKKKKWMNSLKQHYE